MSLNLDKSHWNRVAFGDVVRNVNDYFDADRDGVLPYVAGPNINPGEPSVASYGATDDDEFPPTFKRMFRSGDVLLHSRGIDKLAAADRSGVTGEKLFVLRSVDETVLLQEYLIWLLLSPQAQAHMKDNLTGSVNKFLNWKPLAALEIDIPPLDEQKRIADLLWAVERHRLAMRAIDAPLARCQVPLMEIEADEYVTVGDVVTTARSGATPRRSNKDYYGGEIPWLKSGEVNGDGIKASAESITEAGLENSAAWLAPAGAVVVAMYGDGKTRGQVGRIATPMSTNQAVLALVADDSQAHSAFLYYWLRSRQSTLRAKGAGAAQKNLSKALVVSEPFPALPVSDQIQAVNQVIEIDLARGRVASEVRRLAALRSSLLTEIFGGV